MQEEVGKNCGGCGGIQPADRQSIHRNLARQQCGHRTSLEKSKKRACNLQTVVLLYLLSVDAAASPARSEYGALAQLVARNVRNVEVRGSNPLCSTKNLRNLRFFLLFSYVYIVEIRVVHVTFLRSKDRKLFINLLGSGTFPTLQSIPCSP